MSLEATVAEMGKMDNQKNSTPCKMVLTGHLVKPDIKCNSSNLFDHPYLLNVGYLSFRVLLQGQVKHRVSSRGKYVSVNIGPVQVVCSEQVQAVYNAMRRDDRMKYFL
ncbi:uncharacterized protein LOC111391284 [Olea europaea var. sylvestris]|uniref:uncharacterized protein LOC111391283 n=1 Tax=Olea europaea var. sylvestris TaxID=158386 RepID=UPI000C1D6075|nr:uncharacterized protein LOC111391283 [Olea europaea var. sylvestris]XP_022872223.1 uncharacterized protein LOC111391284 [Olea europaea var. sylvestris]